MKDKINLIGRIFPGNIREDAAWYDHRGADLLYYLDEASFEGAPGDTASIKAISREADLPLLVCGRVRRFEDVKKMIYAGARTVIVREEDARESEEIREAADRFGSERVFMSMKISDMEAGLERARKAVEEKGVGGIFLEMDLSRPDQARIADYLRVHLKCPVYGRTASSDSHVLLQTARMTMADGLILDSSDKVDMMEVKQVFKENQIPVNTFESAVDFDEFKLNSDGMVPCITQDYRTGEVLMLAYMTKESYQKTIATGKMTYYSRSRQELWTKGDTSGHYQYVKSLRLDCDKDTILARVAQIGAACHTGNRTCFFTDLVKKDVEAHNPLMVFEDVYKTILDRKEHPKEGSYTNYLFDQGIDKILKKVGEEATEIVIAAKNPDAAELKYEICDFLYHMMVLMADQDLDWKEITEELAQRH